MAIGAIALNAVIRGRSWPTLAPASLLGWHSFRCDTDIAHRPRSEVRRGGPAQQSQRVRECGADRRPSTSTSEWGE